MGRKSGKGCFVYDTPKSKFPAIPGLTKKQSGRPISEEATAIFEEFKLEPKKGTWFMSNLNKRIFL